MRVRGRATSVGLLALVMILAIGAGALGASMADTAAPSPGVRIAGALYSTSAPSGFYGEVDWVDTFAWSAATGAPQGSTERPYESMGPPGSELP